MSASAEFGFDEQYERNSTILNLITHSRSDNQLNPLNEYHPTTPVKQLNRSPDPSH